MHAALVVRQRPVATDEGEVGDQLVGPSVGEAVVVRSVLGLQDVQLGLPVVHHLVVPEDDVIGALDRYAGLLVVEQRVVDRRPVGRLAAPADALDVLVHRVAHHEAVGGLKQEVYAGVLVPEQGIADDGDVRPVRPDALPTPVRRVVDRDDVARGVVEADAGIHHVPEGEAHHRDVVLALHPERRG